MEEKVQRLFEIYRKTTSRPQNLRIFVIGRDHFLRIVNGRFSYSLYGNEYGYANVTTLDRGKILAVFAKLEFLLDECLNIFFISPADQKTKELADMIKRLPFRQRIDAAKDYALIGASLEKKLKDLSATRNILAHEWDERSATFRKQPLTDESTFLSFQKCLLSAFVSLVDIYKELQTAAVYEQYLDEVIAQLEAVIPKA
jgi:hypothetical protein